MIIDVHAHIFPDAIAEKASVSIAKFYDLPVDYAGSVDTLLRLGDEAGIDKFVVHSVAMTPAHVKSINKFIAASVKAHPDRFIGLGSMHPDMENAAETVQEIIDSGLSGVKLHPDMQQFAVDEDKAYRLYESFADRLPLLVHAGDKRFSYSNPHRIANAMDRFPQMRTIAAHMGGYSEWDEAAETLVGRPNLYVDMSSSMHWMTDEKIVETVRLFGADHVMFASDYPMWNPGAELQRARGCGLTKEEFKQVTWGTAAELFGL